MQFSFPITRRDSLKVMGSALSVKTQYSFRRGFAVRERTTTHLSPLLRRKLVSEEEVLCEIVRDASWHAVEKLIQEVVWRIYWKGYLLRNPTIWTEYLSSLAIFEERLTLDPRLTAIDTLSTKVISSTSEFECMNRWARELRETGYLHNHERMWFASVWIHTLKLPWELGARFFMEHLLDGDPAANTLSVCARVDA